MCQVKFIQGTQLNLPVLVIYFNGDLDGDYHLCVSLSPWPDRTLPCGVFCPCRLPCSLPPAPQCFCALPPCVTCYGLQDHGLPFNARRQATLRQPSDAQPHPNCSSQKVPMTGGSILGLQQLCDVSRPPPFFRGREGGNDCSDSLFHSLF